MRALLVVSVLLASCGDPEIVVPDVLRVITILPAHGSVGIGLGVEPLVYFSHPLGNPAAVQTAIALNCLGAAPCSTPDATACGATLPAVVVTYDAAGQVARLAIDATTPLLAASCYEVAVQEGLTAVGKEVAPLPATIRSVFQTR